VVWVCLATRGPARAVLRAPPDAATGALPAAVRTLPSPFREVPPEPCPIPVQPPPAVRRCEGPLQLDLDRIVLLHRVADVPPPPEFVYRPFVSSRARVALVALPPIDPQPCWVVDEHEAGRRVARGLSVDVAPCVSVGSPPELARRQSRRRAARVTRASARAQ
jgi:hypothetical protein